MDKLQTLRNRLDVIKERNILREQYLEEGFMKGVKKVGKGIATTAVLAGMLGTTGNAVAKDHVLKDNAKDLQHVRQIQKKDQDALYTAKERFKDWTGKEYTVDYNLDDPKDSQVGILGYNVKQKAEDESKSKADLEGLEAKRAEDRKSADKATQVATATNLAGVAAGAAVLKHKFNKFKKKRKADRQVSRFN